LLSALLGAAVSLSSPAQAVSLRSDVLFLLPQESGEVAFLDLLTLRASPHYQPLKQRLLPGRFAHFERFARSVGVDADKDLEWVAWALVPAGPERPGELFLGLAQGQFAPERVQHTFDERKLPFETYRGQTLFPFGTGLGAGNLFFTFLDASTAAFGTRDALELLLETRYGGHPSVFENSQLLERIQEVNGRNDIWVAFDDTYTQLAVRQLAPEVARFPEFDRITAVFRSSVLRMSVGREVTLHFEAWCAEPVDAQGVSLLLQTGLTAQSWMTQKSNPPLSRVLESTTVNTAGERVQVQVEIGEKELLALLEQPVPLF